MSPATALVMNRGGLTQKDETATLDESAAPTFQEPTHWDRMPYRRRALMIGADDDTLSHDAGQDARTIAAAQGAQLTSEIPRRPRVVPRPAQAQFRALHQFEATVLEISDDEFVARTRDITTPTFPDEQVSLPLDDVPPADLDLLKVGAVFYWLIGYETNDEGTRKRTSLLRFRRLPAWSSGSVERIEAEATEMMKLFGAQ